MVNPISTAAQPSIFKFSPSEDVSFDIRMVLIDGDPWFYAVDVCKALGLENTTKALLSLDDDEKSQVLDSSTLNSNQGGEINNLRNIINESGLYTLILRCRDAVKQGTIPHKFRKWVTNEILPSIRKTGSYHVGQNESVPPALPYQPAIEIQVLELTMRRLRVSETSMIRMIAAFCKSNNINSDFLPEYVNEPLVRAITPLLKEMGSDLSSKVARTVNPALEAMGILVHLSRNSKSKGIKKFWSLTEEGLKYGRNETSPSDPRETQPLFFVDRFPELLARLEAYLDEQKRRLI
jgi:prophage antirepressor-like protein